MDDLSLSPDVHAWLSERRLLGGGNLTGVDDLRNGSYYRLPDRTSVIAYRGTYSGVKGSWLLIGGGRLYVVGSRGEIALVTSRRGADTAGQPPSSPTDFTVADLTPDTPRPADTAEPPATYRAARTMLMPCLKAAARVTAVLLLILGVLHWSFGRSPVGQPYSGVMVGAAGVVTASGAVLAAGHRAQRDAALRRTRAGQPRLVVHVIEDDFTAAELNRLLQLRADVRRRGPATHR